MGWRKSTGPCTDGQFVASLKLLPSGIASRPTATGRFAADASRAARSAASA